MLRLTATKGSRDVTLRAEGQLVADWVDLMEAECDRLRATTETVLLDLSGVTYIDSHGVRRLRSLETAGVTLVGAPPLIRLMLAD